MNIWAKCQQIIEPVAQVIPSVKDSASGYAILDRRNNLCYLCWNQANPQDWPERGQGNKQSGSVNSYSTSRGQVDQIFISAWLSFSLSFTPATLDINYGDTQTLFDIQVKEGVFRNDMGIFEVGHVGIIRAVLLRRINARINTNVVAIPE